MSDLQIHVEKADGVKCPRCWKYQGIPSNYQGICDPCVKAILDSTADDYLHNRKPEQTEDDFRAAFAGLQQSIREAYETQSRTWYRSC
jgi:hypothetical protein